MLRTRELAELARSLQPAAFTGQMGPFVLMQRPRPDVLKSPLPSWLRSTAQLPPSNVKGPPAPIDFEDLLVATLPPPLIDGSLQLVIGRSPGCDVVLDDPAVSARHAAISWDGKTAVLSELGSSNGTFLNGLKLGTHAALRSGDMLAFGRSHFVFLSSEEAHGRLRRLR